LSTPGQNAGQQPGHGRDRVAARLELARLHWSLGEREDAVDALERTGVDGPEQRVARLAAELGRELPGIPEFDALRSRLTRLAADATPASPARALDPEPATGEVERPFADGVASKPLPPLATSTLAELLAEQGHAEQALHVAEQVLRQNPGDPRARAVRDRLRPRKGMRQRQIAALEEWLDRLQRRPQGGLHR
jgi:tetratricopeptide (TPR) repeat protein